ncbi:hypothetical protein BGZ67_005315 [Mortierella alpina]|nr:hypothetical protein BGZ67_005315 [Mortierella alpina]
MKYAVQTLSIISTRVYQYLDILKTLSLDIGVDDEEHSAHAHFITDALAAFEELTYADRSDEATSDEDEGDHGFTSSDVHAAPRLADHMEKPSDLTNTYILADDYLKSASEALGLDLDKRVTECKILVNLKMMTHLFHILKHDLEDWMSIHTRVFSKFRSCTKRHRSSMATLTRSMGITTGSLIVQPCRQETRQASKTPIAWAPTSQRPYGSPVECYHITNIYWHNHELARDITGVQYLSAPAKGRIENLLRNGSCLREVLQRLQGGTDHFAKLGKTRVFRNDIITYEDVYKEVYYRMMIIETRKDEDPEVSAQMWLKELAAEGYFTCFQKGVYYGFSSPWQLEQLKKNGDTFCFDGTYKVYGRDNFRISYTPKVVVTDQGSVEILAIRSAFSPVRTELRRIMYESQLDKATALIEKFRLDHVERTDLAKHLEEGYFSENQEQRWMLCYRQGLYGIAIDTNNYVESWHSSLKTHFFKDHRKQRLDSVIYTLVKAVYPFTNAGAESTAWTVVGWTLYRGKR